MISTPYARLSTAYNHFFSLVIRPINILIVFLILSACGQHQTAPISSRQPPTVTQVDTHKVQSGDTLYSIAWQYNLDYRYLARLNKISTNYLIYPGQVLNLKPSKDAKAIKPAPAIVAQKPPKPAITTAVPKPRASVVNKPVPKVKPKAPPVKPPVKTVVKRSEKATPPVASSKPKSNTLSAPQWQWPARGKVLTNFYSKQSESKGIDIDGKKGESVLAAANGVIVYAGNGIRGYGNLVIIRHNDKYLSAYAHNDKINVKEGEQVTGGQRIAELGSTGVGAKNRTILHFQVRKSGKPIDPLTVLPKRNF